jgi:hypothetical protein
MTAFRAGKTVKAKLLHGQRPDLTMDDILRTGADSLGNSNKIAFQHYPLFTSKADLAK